MDPEDYRPILVSDRYVLGETDEGFGIWDVTGGPSPIDTFDPSDEGFERAEQRYDELRRAAIRARAVPGVLLWTAILGALAWTITGAVYGWSSFGWQPSPDLLMRIDAVAFRLLVGAVLVLAAVRLGRGLRGRTDPAPVDRPRGDAAVRSLLLAGLAVWVATAISHATYQPVPIGPDAQQGPSDLDMFLLVAGAVAYRVWVAAATILVLIWLPRLARRS